MNNELDAIGVLRAFVEQSYEDYGGVLVCRFCGFAKSTEMHAKHCVTQQALSVLEKNDAPAAKTGPQLCDQDGCEALATHTYRWMDGKQMYACFPHINALRTIAETLSLGVVLLSIVRIHPEPRTPDGGNPPSHATPGASNIYWVGLDEAPE